MTEKSVRRFVSVYRILVPFRFTTLLAIVGVCLTPSAHAKNYNTARSNDAALCGCQEVPVVDTPAFGAWCSVIDTTANTLTYRCSFGDLSAAETAAHIHGPADPGQNAGVVFALPGGNPKFGVWNYPQNLEADLLAGRMYVNIHSAAHPGGEIRGQIVDGDAVIDGAQETPATATGATGWGVFNLDRDANTLKYYIVTQNLSSAETAAHIHGYALHGTAAGVLYALPAGSPKSGVIHYTEDQEEAIVTGRIYVNIHTANFPGGEIRGQIVPMTIPIDGTQEVPPSGSSAGGIGMISFDPNAHALSYYIWTAGLTGGETAAHIHGFAPPGSNAAVLQALPSGNRKLGVWTFGAGSQSSVFAGLTYINIHSGAFPGGEIRGQMERFYHMLPADVEEAGASPSVDASPGRPNPFRDATTIQLRLERPESVRLAIFDAQGRRIRTLLSEGELAPGLHAIPWDGRDDGGNPAVSGIYYYTLETPGRQGTGKLTLIR